MEEEYRMQKAQVEIDNVMEATKHTNGNGGSEVDADDNASTRGVISPSQTPVGSEAEANTADIPTIRISSESDRMRRANEEIEDVQETDSSTLKAETISVDKPAQAAVSDDADHPDDDDVSSEPFSFSNKRLCERWLDNLFMVLYEVGYFFMA